jgi:hypothetical protein
MATANSRRALVAAATAALVMALNMTRASAEFLSAGDLHAWCQKDRSMASAYAAGMADEAAHSLSVLDSVKPPSEADSTSSALMATAKIGAELIGGSCRPADATLAEVTDALCGFLHDFPGDRHAPPALVFSQAMEKRWPCK